MVLKVAAALPVASARMLSRAGDITVEEALDRPDIAPSDSRVGADSVAAAVATAALTPGTM